MAVPSSGALTMLGLHKEKVLDNYAGFGSSPIHISMYDLVNGGDTNGSQEDYETTNTNSSSYPNTTAPHSFSEWYSYDHDASGRRSDIRLKTDVSLVGHSELNIPIYDFKFKDDLSITHRGVMAQDLIGTDHENAVLTDSDGFYRVDYRMIDVEFETIG